MKAGKIFILSGKEAALSPMIEKNFEKEDILQELLANYPDLLAGDQIDPEDPRRWILIARELGIPDEEEAGESFSLDHLLLDQDGIPTFIECKRSSDTRSRREVVAQMLDYAANGTKYWSMEKLRQRAAEHARKSNRSLDDEILALIEAKDTGEIEEFWQRVESNLRDGTVRLIFVSDEIHKELRRLTEFLNEQMRNTEVLAIEVKQFVGEKHRAIVPRVLGLTESARAMKKPTRAKGKTNLEEFLSKCTPEGAGFFKFILEEAERRLQSVRWGVTGFSVGTSLAPDEPRASFVMCYPKNRVEIWLGYLEYLRASPDEIKNINRDLMEFGIFHESQKAVLVRVTAQNYKRAAEAYQHLLMKIDGLLKKHS
jgi:hypothetical protein